MAKAFTLYSSAIKEFFDGTQDWDTDNHYAILVTSSYSPSATHATLSDVSAHTVSGGGYSPKDMAGETVTTVGAVAKCDANDVNYGSSVTITAKYIIIVVGTVAGSTGADKLVGYMDLSDGAGSVSSVAAAFRVEWSPSGVFQVGTTASTIVTQYSAYRLSYDMWMNEEARYIYCSDNELTGHSIAGPIVLTEYPLQDGDALGSLIDASRVHHDMSLYGGVEWDGTVGRQGPVVMSTAFAGKNTYGKWDTSQATDFDFVSVDGILTIIGRVVFHTSPAANLHILLDNADGTKGWTLRTNTGAGALTFAIYSASSPVTTVQTSISGTTGVPVDFAIVGDGTTIKMYLGDMGTVDHSDTFTGHTAPPTTDLFLGRDNTGSTYSDFTILGLVMLARDTSQGDRERWLNWIGGTDYSTTLPAATSELPYITYGSSTAGWFPIIYTPEAHSVDGMESSTDNRPDVTENWAVV